MGEFPLELLTAANAIALIVLAILFRKEARLRGEQFVKVTKLLVADDQRMAMLEQQHCLLAKGHLLLSEDPQTAPGPRPDRPA